MAEQHTPAQQAVREADLWLNTHRVNDTWRTMSRLRDELVRATDQQAPRPRFLHEEGGLGPPPGWEAHADRFHQ